MARERREHAKKTGTTGEPVAVWVNVEAVNKLLDELMEAAALLEGRAVRPRKRWVDKTH